MGAGSKRRVPAYPDGRHRHEHHHEHVTFPSHRPSPYSAIRAANRQCSARPFDRLGIVRVAAPGSVRARKSPGRYPPVCWPAPWSALSRGPGSPAEICRIFLTCDNAGLAGGFRLLPLRFVAFARYVGGPVPAGMFAEDQLERLRTLPGIGRDDLIRYLTLTPADVAFLDPGRGRGRAGSGGAGGVWAARAHPVGSCAAGGRVSGVEERPGGQRGDEGSGAVPAGPGDGA